MHQRFRNTTKSPVRIRGAPATLTERRVEVLPIPQEGALSVTLDQALEAGFSEAKRLIPVSF